MEMINGEKKLHGRKNGKQVIARKSAEKVLISQEIRTFWQVRPI